jgi:hypothetical protein
METRTITVTLNGNFTSTAGRTSKVAQLGVYKVDPTAGQGYSSYLELVLPESSNPDWDNDEAMVYDIPDELEALHSDPLELLSKLIAWANTRFPE